MKDRQQQAGEGVVFQQVGVFQEAQEKVPFFQQEIRKGSKSPSLSSILKSLFARPWLKPAKSGAVQWLIWATRGLEVREMLVAGRQGF